MANRELVLKRVTEVLNLCDPGTYSKTISARNKTRNASAIADATDEAGLMIITAITERPNEFRSDFARIVVLATDTSGDQLPEHIGPPLSIEIMPSSGGDWVEAEKSDREKIQSYRLNPELVYDEVAHTNAASKLSGKYDIWENRFFFTGFQARLSLVYPPSRSDVGFIPDHMEPIWIRLAIGNNGKVGTGDYDMGLIGSYWKQGLADLEAWKNGHRVFTEVDEPAGPAMPTHAIQ